MDVSLKRRLRRVRAVVLDVDGVLTDGGMYYTETGEVMKKFNTRDGMGIALLIKTGVKVALISGEKTDIIIRRAEKMGVSDVYLGVENKITALNDFLTKHKLSADDVCYVGDDVNDIPPMERVLLAVAVNDAVEDVKKAANVILTKKGGEGAVREIVDLILKSR
ncbi:MAG: hypothetical protein A2W23_09475 [Planctomycetes bacterium RBG_16_43_13]|nr:MAG: hypothetical protein A2W23_09475 [Planctomycetes bacterium RBG_16_43_13]